MTDQPKPGRKTILVLTAFAFLLQLTVMILLATDRITVALAIPLLAGVLIFGVIPAAKSTDMTDKPKPGRKTILVLLKFAALLQTTVIVLMTITEFTDAVDRITVALAIPMLAIVVIVGLLPAMAWIKTNK